MIPALVARHAAAGGDLVEAFRRTVAGVRGHRSRSARPAPTRPDQLLSRCAAAARALYVGLADDLLHRRQRAVRRGRGDRALPPRRRRDAGGSRESSCSTPTRGRRARRHRPRSATTAPRCRSTDDDVVDRRGHHPRHRPRRRAALPAEGDQRGARQPRARRCAARSSSATACCAPSSASGRCRPTIADRLADGSIRARSASSARAPRPSPGRARRRCSTSCADGELDVDAITATELSRLRAAPRHERHAHRSRSARAARRPTPTAPSTCSAARAPPCSAIVNRRNSDLTDKADGVLYTSRRPRRGDERRVDEGVLRAGRGRRAARLRDQPRPPASAPPSAATSCSPSLRDAARRDARGARRRATSIADAAQRFAPSKRYWAVVGNGPNIVAAEEVRIKLSELCYKSIACDVTEDKKHIDLSSEPLILVCAAGLVGEHRRRRRPRRSRSSGPTRRRRSSSPTEGDDRFAAAAAVIAVPPVDPALGVRAVGDGRAPVRLRGGARDRRLGPPAARGTRADRASASPSTIVGDDVLAAVARRDRRRSASGSSTACAPACYDGHLEASRPRCGSAGLLRDLRSAIARSRRTSASPARSARRAR